MIPIKVNRFVVGHVTNDYFVKTLRSSRHFLKKPPAIAFDIQSIEQAKANGAKTILIRDVDNNLYFRATIKKLNEEGFEFNRGHGNQIAMILDKWIRDCIVCFDKDYIIKGTDCGCPNE